MKRLYECEVVYGVCGSMSPGKKNDWVMHNTCLPEVVRLMLNKLGRIDAVYVWTDNCGPQYKCRQNFLHIARFHEQFPEIRFYHCFAEKHDFKGPHDAAGGWLKRRAHDAEMTDRRIPNALGLYHFCNSVDDFSNPKGYAKWVTAETERLPSILDKGDNVISCRTVFYVTDDEEEAARMTAEGCSHIVFTNRSQLKKLKVNAIKDTQLLHSVVGEGESRTTTINGKQVQQYKLTVAENPCACLYCRHDSDGSLCPFQSITKKREEWIYHMPTDDET
jgi:hypothetical protein